MSLCVPSRCNAKTTSHIGYLPELTPLWFRGVCHGFSLFMAVFIMNYASRTNDANLFHFNIREIRLFVLFVIPKRLIVHQYNSSMGRLHSRITKDPDFFGCVSTLATPSPHFPSLHARPRDSPHTIPVAIRCAIRSGSGMWL